MSLFQFTPLREGRLPLTTRLSRSAYFNSRPSARGDRRPVKSTKLPIAKFQFTPLREGRLGLGAEQHQKSYFNSRPSARGDAFLTPSFCTLIFQFTPLREGRRRFGFRSPILIISIHAPPRGATLIVCDDVVNLNISIHAPPRGATR